MRTQLTVVSLLLIGAAGAAQASTFQQTVAADPKGEVEVNNVAGSIEITTWDRPQVSVDAVLDSDDLKVEVESTKGHVEVQVRYPSHGDRGGAHLKIQVPAQSSLDVSAVSSSVSTSGVQGRQEIESVSGEIMATVSAADSELRTVSGRLVARGDGHPAHLRANSVSGDVDIEGGSGNVESTTVSGALTAALSGAQQVHARTTSGSLRLSGKIAPSGTLQAETISGSVTIAATADAGFSYDAETFSGSISDCWGQEAERLSEYVPSKRLTGQRDKGNAHMRIKTLSGSISLCEK